MEPPALLSADHVFSSETQNPTRIDLRITSWNRDLTGPLRHGQVRLEIRMDRRVGTTVTGNKDPVTTWDTVPKSRGCFRCRSASTAGLRQLGKTCELQLLGRFNRTCAAGLRHSVRPANCKRGPLTGFEVPKVGHPFPFLFLFPFPFSTFVFSELHFPLRSRRPFPSPKGGLQLLACPFLLLTFQFFDYTLRLPSCRTFCFPFLLV